MNCLAWADGDRPFLAPFLYGAPYNHTVFSAALKLSLHSNLKLSTLWSLQDRLATLLKSLIGCLFAIYLRTKPDLRRLSQVELPNFSALYGVTV